MNRKKESNIQTKKLFTDEQRELFEKSYLEEIEDRRNRPVKCFEMSSISMVNSKETWLCPWPSRAD